MSQEQDNMEFDNHEDAAGESPGTKKRDVISLLVPVLTFMTIGICTVMLVLVIHLGKKVDGLEEGLQALRDSSMTSGTADSAPDESEAADIAEVAAFENNIVWYGDDGIDKSAGIRRVYLTFDDGPSPNTDRILDILGQYDVKATFFVVGRENYADRYRRIAEEGHTLGMHSFSHRYSEIYASLDAYRQDLTKLHDFLYELTGVDCNIVRFPGGSSNTISHVDMRELTAYLDEENMLYFDWNVSGGDAAGGSQSAGQITENVLNNIDKYNNVVVLLHDAAGKDATVEALPAIIEKILESENTVMLPISGDTVRVQHLHGGE